MDDNNPHQYPDNIDSLWSSSEPENGRSNITFLKEYENLLKDWPSPQPLLPPTEVYPYPVHALPDLIQAAVIEVQSFTKAPLPLVASSALASLSTAAQGHANIRRAEKLTGPIGLYLLTIADSGERKSTCDKFFMQAIHAYESDQSSSAKPVLKQYESEMAVWQSKYDGIKTKIRQCSKESKPTIELEKLLHELSRKKPNHPRIPRLIYTDATPEALKKSLATNWPLGAIVSSEAGLVFGSHAMNRESIMRSLATFNQLWDGQDIATDRTSSDSYTVRGARMSIALQVQELTFRDFFDCSKGLARGSGFLARFLIAWPESTQGIRFFEDAPESWPALDKFNTRITELLNFELEFNSDNVLSPLTLDLSHEAKAAWVALHNQIEKELRSGGEFYDIRDVASKTADNAARIAALFHLLEGNPDSQVELSSFSGAAEIAKWHLNEALRFYGELAIPQEQLNTVQMDRWLIDYCRRTSTGKVSRRHVQRHVTPARLRDKKALNQAIQELRESGHIREFQDGNRKYLTVNPSLLTEPSS